MLARELGMTVKEMLKRMDSREYTEWIAFYKVRAEEAPHDEEQKPMDGAALMAQLKAALPGR
jgi:hypothetical protein